MLSGGEHQLVLASIATTLYLSMGCMLFEYVPVGLRLIHTVLVLSRKENPDVKLLRQIDNFSHRKFVKARRHANSSEIFWHNVCRHQAASILRLPRV